MPAKKLTTTLACRVARLNRDRFNEHVAAGRFPCAPATVPGRTRLFDPDDMVALWLFRELMDDGFDASRAGAIARVILEGVKMYPGASSISYVVPLDGDDPYPYPTNDLPPLFEGCGIASAMSVSVRRVRRDIAGRLQVVEMGA